MNLREFADSTRDQRRGGRNTNVTPEDMDRRFDIYKEGFIKKQNEYLFKNLSTQEWCCLDNIGSSKQKN